MEIIDFHNHHIPSRFQEAVVRAAPPHHPMRRVLVDAMRRAGLSETEQQALPRQIAAGCSASVDLLNHRSFAMRYTFIRPWTLNA